MKAKVSQALLFDALQRAGRAISSNCMLPILHGFRLQFLDDRMTVTGGNEQMTIYAGLPLIEQVRRNEADSKKPGPTGLVIPARYMVDIARKLQAPLVELELEDRPILTVRSGGSTFRLCGMELEEYPEMPPLDLALWQLTVPNALLKSMIRQVAFAASTSEIRPLLSGVLCRFDGSSLRLVATDSVRFASHSSRIGPEVASAAFEAIIPGKALAELAKLLQDTQEETTITAYSGHIVFNSSDVSLSCSLLHGTYPPIDKLVPSGYTAELTADTLQLLHAMERVTLLAGEGSVVRLQTGPNTGEEQFVELLAGSAEIGNVREHIRVDHVQGEAIAVSFNGKYMTDILRAMNSSTVKLKFSEKLGPIVAEPLSPIPTSIYLLTRIRTAV